MSAINRIRHRDDEEGGFTLIELLVVVIIIGILAAIAIPTFLNQRKKGWESAVKSDLRNYAIVMETELTETGSYAAAFATTPPVESNDVTLTVPTADAATYCLEGGPRQADGCRRRLEPATRRGSGEGGLLGRASSPMSRTGEAHWRASPVLVHTSRVFDRTATNEIGAHRWPSALTSAAARFGSPSWSRAAGPARRG